MNDIIPAIIPTNLGILREQFGKVLHLVKKVQVDILDGRYTPTKSWPFRESQFDEFLEMTREEGKFPYIDQFEVQIDMLLLHPIEYLGDFISIGAKSFIFHIDSTDHLKECIETAKSASCKVGLGVKPSGNIQIVEDFLFKVDFVQFMGNDKVGYNGVSLDPEVLKKIADFHARHPSIPLQIDIGVSEESIPKLRIAGISSFVSSSSIFNSGDPRAALKKLREI